jgi:hypothetical protein
MIAVLGFGGEPCGVRERSNGMKGGSKVFDLSSFVRLNAKAEKKPPLWSSFPFFMLSAPRRALNY